MGNTPELSIGALSTAVGIPVGTLRTWERRYGVPKSDRLPSGHRRYSVDVVEKLLLVRDLLQRGHRPSALLRSNVQELQRLRGALGGDMARSAVVRHRAGDGRFEEWFEALASADADALSRILHESWARYGYVSFLDDHLGPFLVEVGLRWTTGQLGIGEEHFATHVITSFLSSRWQPVGARPGSPVVIGAVLSAEQHTIGLHMAAAALALDGWHVRFLGADTPVESVASMCIQHDAAAVAIGTSPTANANRLAEDLKVLRAAIGPDVPIWVGGRLIPLAARGTVEGLVNMAQLLERARSYRHARGLMRKGYGNK